MTRSASRLVIRQNADGCQFCSSHAANSNGYTMYTLPGKQPRPLYQIRYEAVFGKRKEGERLQRTCKGGKGCVNPAHYRVHVYLIHEKVRGPKTSFCGKKFHLPPHVLMGIVAEVSSYKAASKYGVTPALAVRVQQAYAKAHGIYVRRSRSTGLPPGGVKSISDEVVREIYTTAGRPADLAKRFGVSQAYISNLKRGLFRRKTVEGLILAI